MTRRDAEALAGEGASVRTVRRASTRTVTLAASPLSAGGHVASQRRLSLALVASWASRRSIRTRGERRDGARPRRRSGGGLSAHQRRSAGPSLAPDRGGTHLPAGFMGAEDGPDGSRPWARPPVLEPGAAAGTTPHRVAPPVVTPSRGRAGERVHGRRPLARVAAPWRPARGDFRLACPRGLAHMAQARRPAQQRVASESEARLALRTVTQAGAASRSGESCDGEGAPASRRRHWPGARDKAAGRHAAREKAPISSAAAVAR